MSNKKSTTSKDTPAKSKPSTLIDDMEEEIIPSRVTNKRILEKLIEMERRLIRIEKLILFNSDDQFFTREEMSRVQMIDQMLKEGRIDELLELQNDNKF